MAMTEFVGNIICGGVQENGDREWLEKLSPHDGSVLYRVARSDATDVDRAVAAARAAQLGWAAISSVQRGKMLNDVVLALRHNRVEMAAVVAAETGKSPKDALGETDGAIQLAEFFAGEGMRLYGRSLNSGDADKQTITVREPLGVAALIIAANTPIANAAWKVFPALICGNTVVLKAAEDTPRSAAFLAEIASSAGLPDGVLNVIQGLGAECGEALVDHPDINLISFTGSTQVGRRIAERAGRRLVRVSLELGGKNPLVVCDDADLDCAVQWTALSAFSNAGQRCAAASRVIVFSEVYGAFRERLIKLTENLRLGNADDCDLGPVINRRQLDRMVSAIQEMVGRGGKILCGGAPLSGELTAGCYMQPTVMEGLGVDDELADCELFGPVVMLYRVEDFAEAVELANSTSYGLTAAIHTLSIDRGMDFSRRVRAGVVNVNGGTYGSEPHYPFGGFGQSGNGTREPGVEALNVYSELKSISIIVDGGRT